MLEKSRVLVDEMAAVWEFVSINQDTINYTSDGVHDYKSLHCAIAGKSVAAPFSRNSDYSIHFTNLNPRNFNNEPDDYEAEALRAFEADPSVTERYGFAKVGGQSVFRYVSVMKVSENCIECHGGPKGEIDVTGYPKEGWEAGDIAGAVSVVVPTELSFANMNASIVNNAPFFVLLMACMAVVFYVVLSRLVTNPLTNLQESLALVADGSRTFLDGKETPVQLARDPRELYASREVDDLFEQFDSMARRLAGLYANLESQVSERTEQLSAANLELDRQRRRVEEINAQLARDNRVQVRLPGHREPRAAHPADLHPGVRRPHGRTRWTPPTRLRAGSWRRSRRTAPYCWRWWTTCSKRRASRPGPNGSIWNWWTSTTSWAWWRLPTSRSRSRRAWPCPRRWTPDVPLIMSDWGKRCGASW